jgi:hypothetical protein
MTADGRDTAGHTPGPWKYEIGIPDAKTGELHHLITDDNGIVLADVNERHEDGYLMAVAPDLLAVCKAFLAEYEKAQNSYQVAIGVGNVLAEMISAVRKAEVRP